MESNAFRVGKLPADQQPGSIASEWLICNLAWVLGDFGDQRLQGEACHTVLSGDKRCQLFRLRARDSSAVTTAYGHKSRPDCVHSCALSPRQGHRRSGMTLWAAI